MHINCPHCHNPIEVVESADDAEILCPSCGSKISRDELRTRTARGPTPPVPHVGKFVLKEKLGEGAFGSVWLAEDPDMKRLVAVKLPRPGVIGGKDDEERFVREARAAGNLKHEGIVTVHEVGRHDGTLYIVSDFVHGVNLAEWLSARRPDFREAAQMLAQVAEAIGYAHRLGVVHRDLKPANIMVHTDITKLDTLRPVIMDFGLAKRAAGELTITRHGGLLGTPAYMSPEQARGESHRADARSDVWSLGVVLYELLTGERPFRGVERMIMLQILQDEPRPPRRLNEHIPRDLETITLKCLQKDPQRRYPSAAELRDELGRWLRGEPIQARPVSNAERIIRWCRRNPTVASLTGAVAVLLVAVAVGSLLMAGRERGLRSEADKARDRADREAKRARRLLYVSHMNPAQAAYEDARVGRVLELLDQHVPTSDEDLRGFEWYYWKRLCHRDLVTLKGHTSVVISVAFSPDGQRIASASGDQTVKLWDAATGQEVATLKGHTDGVTSVTFSPDGQRIASASGDQTVKLWDAATGQESASLLGSCPANTYVKRGPLTA